MALKETQKAKSLPEDLKKHWVDAMADKFPLSRDEAEAYIVSEYGDFASVDGGDTLSVSIIEEGGLREGEAPPVGASVADYGHSPSWLGRRRVWRRFEYVYFDDYKKSTIDKVMSKYKKEK